MVILKIILNRAVTLHVSNISKKKYSKSSLQFSYQSGTRVQPVGKGKGEVTKVKAAPPEISDPQYQ